MDHLKKPCTAPIRKVLFRPLPDQIPVQEKKQLHKARPERGKAPRRSREECGIRVRQDDAQDSQPFQGIYAAVA